MNVKGFKKVTAEEFEKFIKSYPRKLKSNFMMDWLDFYDFPDEAKPEGLEELYSYIVARIYYDEHYIKAESEEE